MRAAWLILIVCAGRAVADESPADRVAADSLFAEGRRLIAAGKLADGCAKLEGSMKVLPRLGTRLNLADCHEKLGKTATAWGEWLEAAAQAKKEKDDREALARTRAAALEPKLAKLRVQATPSAGLVLSRDGAPVDASIIGVAIPVDPGDHEIAASAPGATAWSAHATATPGQITEVTVPALASAGKAPPRPGVVIHDHPASSPRKAIGWAVGAAGVVAIGAGIALGFAAKSQYDGAFPSHCLKSDASCDGPGYDAVQAAYGKATGATILVGVGVAAVATGAILVVTGHRGREQPRAAALWIAPSAGGLVAGGSF